MSKFYRSFTARMFDRAMRTNLSTISNALTELPLERSTRLLDLGTWDGVNTRRYCPPQVTVYGVEADVKAGVVASGRAIRVTAADLDARLPLRDDTFDGVVSNQVIEHLHDTDVFLSECYRVLKPGGLFVASTENMASWHNIAALMLGWQPFSLTNVSQQRAGIGNPLANTRGDEPFTKLWEHQRVFAHRGLKELVEAHGFRRVRVDGAGYYPLPARAGVAEPRHSALITVVGRKRA